MKPRHRTIRRMTAPIIFAGLVAALLVTALWERIVVTIPAGHAGVLWHLFFGGTKITTRPLGEGLHIILPWDKVFIYDTRLGTHTEDYDVMSLDGLQIRIRMHYRWRVVPSNLPFLTKTVGPDYLKKLLIPAIGSVLAEVVAQYKAEQIYSTERDAIQARVLAQATSDRVKNGIALDAGKSMGDDVIALIDVLIREVVLPPSVREAIERKVSEAQYVQEYEYRLQRETLEARRKEIEATGIRLFQDTVTPGMSDNYLKWRGIEATQKLAESPNSKIIIMGNGDRGLPVLLNASEDQGAAKPRDDTPPSPEPNGYVAPFFSHGLSLPPLPHLTASPGVD